MNGKTLILCNLKAYITKLFFFKAIGGVTQNL